MIIEHNMIKCDNIRHKKTKLDSLSEINHNDDHLCLTNYSIILIFWVSRIGIWLISHTSPIIQYIISYFQIAQPIG
jgi:hypothetical protein